MSAAKQRILQQALDLSPDERAELMDDLRLSLEEQGPDVDAAWGKEIERRLNDVQRGTVKPLSREEASRQLDERLSRGHRR